MAPESAVPQPPFDRSKARQREKSSQHGQAGEPPEAYGPLEIERHVKDDGRALILYARREHAQA